MKIISPKKEAAGEKELPKQFKEPVRVDLIKRAVLTLQSNKRQKYVNAKKSKTQKNAQRPTTWLESPSCTP